MQPLRFAPPLAVSSAAECSWYHTFQFPDGTMARATWDLRDSIDDYLGRLDLRGKSVIEIGPASGFLTVSMEQRGASVVCIENSLDQTWEYVPRVDIDSDEWMRLRRLASPSLFRSWWYSQRAFNCSAKVVYCGVSALRDVANLLNFDVCLIGGVLQHVRYPFDVLWSASRIAKTIIVTERWLPDLEQGGPRVRFVPAPENRYLDTWFYLSSTAVTNALRIFGFEPEAPPRRFTVRAWEMKDTDIAKDSFIESDHYNMVFHRTS